MASVARWVGAGSVPVRLHAAWLLTGWLLSGWLLSGTASAQKPQPPGTVVADPFGVRCDQLVLQAAPRYWGAALVVRAGVVQLAKGYGYADRQKVPLGPQALFDCGPASELLTRALVLQQAAAGRLQRGESIAKALPDWPADTNAPTLDQVLRRVSGLPVEMALPANQRQAAAVVRALAKSAPRPGLERWTPWDAVLLALCAEGAGPQRFDGQLTELFGKAGMATMAPTNGRIDSRWLTLRRSDANERGEAATAAPYDWTVRGSSRLLGSVYDLHHFALWLASGALAADDLQELFRPVAAGRSLSVQNLGAATASAVVVAAETQGYRLRCTLHLPSRSWCVLFADDLTAVDAVQAALQAELAAAMAPASAPGAAGAGAPVVAAAASAAADPQRWLGRFALPGDGGRFVVEASEAGLLLRGEGVAAAARLQFGSWPGAHGPALQRLAGRGQAVLERLARGDATVLGEAFAVPAAGTRASDLVGELRASHGNLVRVEPLVVKTEPASAQFRWVGANGTALVQVRFAAGLQVAEVALDRGPAGQSLPLAVVRADVAAARSTQGPELRLTMEGRAGQRVLVFGDGSVGPEGLIECREVTGG